MPPPNPPSRKPADVSAQNKERNEYIPSFISKQPFYVTNDSDSQADYLEHQRIQRAGEESVTSAKFEDWYERGAAKVSSKRKKWRDGACENCGAMGHVKRDCLQRMRKRPAKYTNEDIMEDDNSKLLGKMGWDAKRDRWNGYVPAEHVKVVEEFNEAEERQKRLEAGGEDENADGEEDKLQDGVRYQEETDMGRAQSTATRNLRIREDTAKYLLNLDLDSAKYDPKTRSMVDSGATADQAAALVAEEGFIKASGDAAEFEKAQHYAWEAQERGTGNAAHLQANPTAAANTRRKEVETAQAEQKAKMKELMDKYGDQQSYTNNSTSQIAVIESERYVEYDEDGAIKGAPKTKPKSMYEEDVYINNHTSVWGSWWHEFKWGYACCYATVKNSYCTGEEGRRAMAETDKLIEQEQVPKQIAWAEEVAREEHVPNGVDDDAKVKADIQARKRKLEEMKDGVTEDEIEKYRRNRPIAGDPMAKVH